MVANIIKQLHVYTHTIIPGMLMIGYWQDFAFWQTLLVSACGGCLGVLFTIPLRRAMVVHSDLAYPEGVAAAE